MEPFCFRFGVRLIASAILCGAIAFAQQRQPVSSGRVLVQFHPEIPDAQAGGVVAALGARPLGRISQIGVQIVQLPANADENAFVNAFRARPEVNFAELDRIVPPADLTPNDPWYANWEWHLKKISGPTAWSTTTGSAGTIVAIIDTGVDSSHPDLSGNLIAGWNIYSGNSDTSDVYGHGTAVAGTAGASSNNATGVASVCWNCWLMPIRVSASDGTASYSNLASGIIWGADHGARVANISYVVSGSSTVTAAAQYLWNKGGVTVSSAGNYGTFDSTPHNPYILTVSATDPNDVLYSWSDSGDDIDLAAPGCVYTTLKGGQYGSGCGTSYAAPIVAGVAGLLFSLKPSLAPSDAIQILEQSSDDLGPAGWDTSYGWGRINAARAVSLTGGGSTSDTQPPVVSFTSPGANATVSGNVAIQVAASDNVGVVSVSVTLDGSSLCSWTVAPYTCSWSTGSAVNGSHMLVAVARDAAGNSAMASLTVNVNNADTTPPVVTITSPANGATVSGTVTIAVSASDNVGVTHVDLYVNGTQAGTSTSAPFSFRWNSRKAPVPSTLQVKAYDAAGNSAASQVITVY